MKNFITGAIKKSRTSLSILVLLALSGIFSLNTLPKATEPHVSFPGAYIGVDLMSITPEIVLKASSRGFASNLSESSGETPSNPTPI